jgi:hypothetical protein
MWLSRATAARHWAYARAWLYNAIEGRPPTGREFVPEEIPPE